jgi:hypothetical protein
MRVIGWTDESFHSGGSSLGPLASANCWVNRVSKIMWKTPTKVFYSYEAYQLIVTGVIHKKYHDTMSIHSSALLRQPVRTQSPAIGVNIPSKGRLSDGFVSKAVH